MSSFNLSKSPPSIIKDPDAVLDYLLDWTAWLPEDDIISDVEFIADEGITVEEHTFTDTTATVWLSSGEDKTKYLVTCRITTQAGRVDDRSFIIAAKSR